MSRFQYPKLLLLGASFVVAYALYHQGAFDLLPSLLHGRGYVSLFIAGILFSFGFTAAFAVAIIVEMSDVVHPVLGAAVAGIGALISDFGIFQFVRLSFLDEVKRLRASAVFLWLRDRLHQDSIPERIRQYIQWSIGGILIASPLPDEIGVTLLSGLSELKPRPFAIACYSLNSLGILAILLSSRSA